MPDDPVVMSDTRKKIELIPFTCGAGAQRTGCEKGPSFIKQAGLQKDLGETLEVSWQVDPDEDYAREVSSYENLPALGSAERRAFVLEKCIELSHRVEQAVKRNVFPVTIGGDHVMAAGSIAGFARAKKAQGRVGVVWVDAHTDINSWATSPSQAIHGMPIAALLGLMGDDAFSGIGGERPVLKPENLAYVGLRSVDPGEEEILQKLGIKMFRMKNIRQNNVQDVLQQAFDHVSLHSDHIVLSIDMDSFDPRIVSSVGSPEKKGLRRKDVLQALKSLRTDKLGMIEIAEFNPTRGKPETSYRLLVSVLKTALETALLR